MVRPVSADAARQAAVSNRESLTYLVYWFSVQARQIYLPGLFYCSKNYFSGFGSFGKKTLSINNFVAN